MSGSCFDRATPPSPGFSQSKFAYSKALHIHDIQHVKNNDKRSTRARVPIETAKYVVYAVVGLGGV
jgi:hypothetical protein